MKSFRSYISEDSAVDNKPPTNADKVRERQGREKEELKARQDRELARAREQDFQKKEADRRQELAKKKSEADAKKNESVEDESDSSKADYVPEYLEDGTEILVKAYKSATPKQ